MAGTVFSFMQSLPSHFAFSRASKAWGFNATGTLTEFANGISRQTYDPATLVAQGTRIEPMGSTNQVRNPRCEGATPGTPGTPPTNMVVFATAGLSSSIVAVGTESGIPYVDVRWFGTTTGTATATLRFDTATAIAALTGQTWTASAFVRLIAGSLANANPAYPQLQIIEGTSTGTFEAGGGQTIAPTGAALATQRAVYTRTLSGGATVAVVQENFTANFPTATVVDFTVRIGLPQIEQLGWMSSPIMPPVGSPNVSSRAVESLTLALPCAGFPGPVGWTALMQFMPSALPGNVAALGMGGTSGNFSAAIMGNDNRLYATKSVGGTNIASGGSPNTIAIGTASKFALAQRSADIRASLSGGAVAAAVNAGYPLMDTLTLLQAQPGYVQLVRLWPTNLNDGALQAVTA
jgi:hypothetical protein